MEARKILFIRLSSIGDVTLLAPAVAALKQRYPEAELHLLTRKHLAPLWNADPRVTVRFFDAAGEHYGLPGFFRFLKALRAEEYDVVVDLHGLPKTWLLSRLLGARVLRYDKAAVQRRRYVATGRGPENPVHVSRRYVRALAPLGVETEGMLDPHIEVAERARETSGTMVQAVGIRGRTIIGIAPGSQWATKQWGWERYDELVRRLNEQGHWVALIGGKEDRDRCEEIAAGRQVLNFAGLLNLSETLALMDFCRLVVSTDSGPMHMAGARGADVIGIFGSTTPALGFWPLAAQSSVVEVDDLSCRPCSPHGRETCPKGHFRCMQDIAVERVWDEVQRFLGPPPSPGDGDEGDSGDDNEGLFILSD